MNNMEVFLNKDLLPIWVLIIIALLMALSKYLFPHIKDYFQFKSDGKDSVIKQLKEDNTKLMNECESMKSDIKTLMDSCEIIKEELNNYKIENASIKGYFEGIKSSLKKLDIELEFPKLNTE